MYLTLYILKSEKASPVPKETITIDIQNQSFLPSYIDNDLLNKYVVLAFTSSLSTDISAIYNEPETNQTEILAHGLLCRVLDTNLKNNQHSVTLSCLSRVRIPTIEQTTDNEGNIYLHSDVAIIQEQLLPHEDHIKKSIITIIESLDKKNKLNELPTARQQLTYATEWYEMMDILAGSFLVSAESRTNYIQLQDNTDRWLSILDIIEKMMLKSTPSINTTQTIPSTDTKDKTTDIIQRYSETTMPDIVRAKTKRDVDRLQYTPKSSNEYSNTLDYLNWLLDIPWSRYSYRKFKLTELQKRLDESHHGLQEVKQHLIEHMYIEQLQNKSAGTILCFVGPPGTGKTTIARQIAYASGRPCQHIALGGLNDEAELRGHRRTYLGARPSRIVTSLRDAKCMDPVIILDEVDKISGHKGDPAAALLEILDPAQNHSFVDRYMDIPIDLSNILFICTANYKEQIPEALQDRIEFITFRTYTHKERNTIIQKHLLPRCFQTYKLDTTKITINNTTIEKLAQVKQIRQTEFIIKKLLRYAATQMHLHNQSSIVIEPKDIPNTSIKKNPIGFRR
jgi:ATP-dependent Lon protease